jgi:hypothetical protein
MNTYKITINGTDTVITTKANGVTVEIVGTVPPIIEPPVPPIIIPPTPNPFAAQFFPNPSEGYDGTVVALNGRGFRQNTAVTFEAVSSDGFADRGTICSAMSDNFGQVASGFTVIGWDKQEYRIVANDGLNVATAVFTVI